MTNFPGMSRITHSITPLHPIPPLHPVTPLHTHTLYLPPPAPSTSLSQHEHPRQAGQLSAPGGPHPQILLSCPTNTVLRNQIAPPRHTVLLIHHQPAAAASILMTVQPRDTQPAIDHQPAAVSIHLGIIPVRERFWGARQRTLAAGDGQLALNSHTS